MKNNERNEKVLRFQLPHWKWQKVLKYLVVLGMAGVGVAMMMGGFLAWVIGEQVLLVTGVVTGAVFVSAGGLGMLRCLDGE